MLQFRLLPREEVEKLQEEETPRFAEPQAHEVTPELEVRRRELQAAYDRTNAAHLAWLFEPTPERKRVYDEVYEIEKEVIFRE
jgi:hypothetical protein